LSAGSSLAFYLDLLRNELQAISAWYVRLKLNRTASVAAMQELVLVLYPNRPVSFRSRRRAGRKVGRILAGWMVF
jgi:hypothetical protein